MKFKTAAITLTFLISAITSNAEQNGGNSKAANSFRQASKEYTQQAKEYYSKAKNAEGKQRGNFLSAAKMSEQLAQLKLGFAKAADQGDWDTVKKLTKKYEVISAARSKILWGDKKK